MITIDSLTKRRRGRPILDDVTFSVRPGSVTGFLGPNGAGKSSTLRVLLGLDRASSGTALVGGRVYRDLRRPLRHVGSLLDGAAAHPSRTGRQHLRWMAVTNQLPSGRVDEVLDQVGLAHAAGKRVSTYSVGMSQRLGIAAALLGSPEVLVLDEPTNGLDPDGIVWLRTLVRSHADHGGTVLLSSHLMSEVAAVADDLVVIAQGRVTATGSLAEVTRGYGSVEDAFFALTRGDR